MHHESIIETTTTAFQSYSQISVVASSNGTAPAHRQRVVTVEENFSVASLTRSEFPQGDQSQHQDHDYQCGAMEMQNLPSYGQSKSRFLFWMWWLVGKRLGQDVSPSETIGIAFIMVCLVGGMGWQRSKAKITEKGSQPKKERKGQRKRQRKGQGRHGSPSLCCWTLYLILTGTASFASSCSELSTVIAYDQQSISGGEETVTYKGRAGAADFANASKDSEVTEWIGRGSDESPSCFRRSNAEGDHKELSRSDYTALGSARKTLSDLDQEWEDYRMQWANYMDTVSRTWIEQAESFEQGESAFMAKRKEAVDKIQELRAKLNTIHQKTMQSEQAADTEKAEAEAEIAQMDNMDQDDNAAEEARLENLKTQMTSAVQVLKDSIEARVKHRPRSRSARRHDKDKDDEVQILDPAPKQPKKTPGGV